MANTIKITKKDYYSAILAYFTELEPFTTVAGNVTAADVLKFCEHEIEILDKRASAPTKPNKATVIAANDTNVLVDIVSSSDEAMTVAEIIAASDGKLEGKNSCQRISALLTKAVNDGRLANSTVKKVSYYRAV